MVCNKKNPYRANLAGEGEVESAENGEALSQD
jgi:hypothetical protein